MVVKYIDVCDEILNNNLYLGERRCPQRILFGFWEALC